MEGPRHRRLSGGRSRPDSAGADASVREARTEQPGRTGRTAFWQRVRRRVRPPRSSALTAAALRLHEVQLSVPGIMLNEAYLQLENTTPRIKWLRMTGRRAAMADNFLA